MLPLDPMTPCSNKTNDIFARLTAARRIDGFINALKHWPVRGFFALVDQGLISGSNFILAIFLARWLTPRDYGAYALAFEVFLFVSIVYASLILEPMSVFGASTYKQDFRAYLRILLQIHSALSVVIVVLVFFVAWVVSIISPASPLPEALVGVGLASPCLLLFWLARRGFYVHLIPQKAVLGGCIYSAIVLSGLLLVFKLRALSPLSAFLIVSVGALISGPVMLRWLKDRTALSPAGHIALKDVVRRHWNYGAWALASATVIWLSGAIYYPLLGTFFTLAKTGEFKALMNLASPIGQIFVALSLLSLPHASRAYNEHGFVAAKRLSWQLSSLYIGGTSLYWACLLLLRGPVIHHLYGGKYLQIVALLPWVALGSILRIAATAQAIVLRAMHLPALVFAAYSAACIVAILVGIPCTRWFGLRGAVFAWMLSSAAALTGAIIMIRRRANQEKTSEAAPAGPLVLQEETSVSAR